LLKAPWEMLGTCSLHKTDQGWGQWSQWRPWTSTATLNHQLLWSSNTHQRTHSCIGIFHCSKLHYSSIFQHMLLHLQSRFVCPRISTACLWQSATPTEECKSRKQYLGTTLLLSLGGCFLDHRQMIHPCYRACPREIELKTEYRQQSCSTSLCSFPYKMGSLLSKWLCSETHSQWWSAHRS